MHTHIYTHTLQPWPVGKKQLLRCSQVWGRVSIPRWCNLCPPVRVADGLPQGPTTAPSTCSRSTTPRSVAARGQPLLHTPFKCQAPTRGAHRKCTARAGTAAAASSPAGTTPSCVSGRCGDPVHAKSATRCHPALRVYCHHVSPRSCEICHPVSPLSASVLPLGVALSESLESDGFGMAGLRPALAKCYSAADHCLSRSEFCFSTAAC